MEICIAIVFAVVAVAAEIRQPAPAPPTDQQFSSAVDFERAEWSRIAGGAK